MKKKCKGCGEEFNADRSKRKFCSRPCFQEYTKRIYGMNGKRNGEVH